MRAQGRSGLVETLLLVGDTTPQSASPTAPLAQGSRETHSVAAVRPTYKNVPPRAAHLNFLPRRGKKHNPPKGRT